MVDEEFKDEAEYGRYPSFDILLLVIIFSSLRRASTHVF